VSLPEDIKMHLEALPYRAVDWAYTRLFAWAYELVWDERPPDPADSREYTLPKNPGSPQSHGGEHD